MSKCLRHCRICAFYWTLSYELCTFSRGWPTCITLLMQRCVTVRDEDTELHILLWVLVSMTETLVFWDVMGHRHLSKASSCCISCKAMDLSWLPSKGMSHCFLYHEGPGPIEVMLYGDGVWCNPINELYVLWNLYNSFKVYNDAK